jgi:uncharacterized protein (DUF58 family)
MMWCSVVEHPVAPSEPTVAEIIRSLEITITRRLDGVLHGNHHGFTPGHGSEPGESRQYQPGDDVRRIDWNLTARTQETHVREQIADRDLEAWLVVDTSAAMRFGTVRTDKASVALSAAGAVGFLTARNQNRLGAVLVTGPELRVIPPRGGRVQVQAVLRLIAATTPIDGGGRAAVGSALDRVGAISRRRGFAAVICDFTGDQWIAPLTRLGLRHDVLAIAVTDPREHEVPPIGMVDLVDPATGISREIRVTARVQRAFAQRAAERREFRDQSIRRSGADLVELSTQGDWLEAIVRHVQRRRVQAVRGGVLRR